MSFFSTLYAILAHMRGSWREAGRDKASSLRGAAKTVSQKSAPQPRQTFAAATLVARAPAWLRPYLKLARADRPIGTWLLFWPCAWGATLAAAVLERPVPNPWHIVLFIVGAFVMRSAGCVWNDIVDRDIDAKVARTRTRPLPGGEASVKGALIFLGVLLLTGLLILLQFNVFTIALGIAALVPVATYPFMKRITWWPQAVLGVCFSWGALVGYAAATGTLSAPAILLYVGSVLWVIGYDTIYALQDIEDDALAGVRSTARAFGENVRAWLGGLYASASLFIGSALFLSSLGPAAWIGLFVFSGHLLLQVRGLKRDDPATALILFLGNHRAAFALFVGLLTDVALTAAGSGRLY